MATGPSVCSEDGVVGWAAQIASQAHLGDARLEARMALILESFARQPHDRIPQACGDAHQAKAVYRFLQNGRFGYQQLAACFGAVTAGHCLGMATIYVVEDSTSFNYSNLKTTTGLGLVNDSTRARGLHLHSAIALDSAGIVRGVLDLEIWARSTTKGKAAQRKDQPIEKKESFKWIVGMRRTRQAFADYPLSQRPRLVYVMDREGDIHEVFEELDGKEGLIVRCAQNRSIAGPIAKAHDAVARSACLGTMPLRVPAKDKQPERLATLEVRALQVTLTPNVEKHPRRWPVRVMLIEAREVAAPLGVAPILWRLWTTEPAALLEQAVAVIRSYSLRWRIEEYHLVLKSGCAVEKLELETAARLAKAIALYAAVAVRIVALRDCGRTTPEAPCTTVLSDLEWRLLWRRFQKRIEAADQQPPTIGQAMRWIGRLGGHLGRKGDGLPGVRTLWRGWRDLALMVGGYRIALRC